MPTLVRAPRLTTLHRCVTNLIDRGGEGIAELGERFDLARTSAAGYHGPDPWPIIRAVSDRLRAHGVGVSFVNSARHSDRFPGFSTPDASPVWGYTDLLTDRVILRDDMTPQGTLLTLAHEGGHALTKYVDTLILHPLVEDALEQAYGIGAAYIAGEVDAEVTGYLVGAATGTALDVEVHAAYIAGYLGALTNLGAPPDLIEEIWQRASRHGHRSAEIMLGGAE